jgi:hypothetical protein
LVLEYAGGELFNYIVERSGKLTIEVEYLNLKVEDYSNN